MATQTVIVESSSQWVGPTLQLLDPDDEDAVLVDAGGVATQGSVNTVRWKRAFIDVPAGRYAWQLLDSGVVVAAGFVKVDLATGDYLAEGLKDPAAVVNAEVLDVLTVDTHAELAGPPAATSSLKDKLAWMFMWARNKSTQTSAARTLFADDGTTPVSTAGVSDDGMTFTKEEDV
jgi:hypothetical protein